MRRRKRVLMVLGVFGILAAVGIVAACWPSDAEMTPGISVENFRRLKLGMTVAEVEEILGRPGEFEPLSPNWKQWHEEGLFLSVGFGKRDGTVNYACANAPIPGVGRTLFVLEERPSILVRVRRWFGF